MISLPPLVAYLRVSTDRQGQLLTADTQDSRIIMSVMRGGMDAA